MSELRREVSLTSALLVEVVSDDGCSPLTQTSSPRNSNR